MNDITILNKADSIIEQIQTRDSKIKLSQKELVILWIQQGLDMLVLGEEYNYTQKDISELTGVSVGSVNLYLTYASDVRLVSLIFSSEQEELDNKCIERFNQKELKKLTTLNNVDFNTTIESGIFPKSAKDDKSIELTIEEQINNKQEHIVQLEEEIQELKVSKVVAIDAEVIDVSEIKETSTDADKELILKAIEKAGGGSALSREFGLHSGTISNYKSGAKPLTKEKRKLFINYLEPD